MEVDERAIRELIATWIRATSEGDLDTVLKLMSEDVVFLGPGKPPMRGRDAFARTFREGPQNMQIEGNVEVQEIEVAGDLAYTWVQLSVSMTPRSGGTPKQMSGPALSILRRQSDGRWVIARDANMLTPIEQTNEGDVPR